MYLMKTRLLKKLVAKSVGASNKVVEMEHCTQSTQQGSTRVYPVHHLRSLADVHDVRAVGSHTHTHAHTHPMPTSRTTDIHFLPL